MIITITGTNDVATVTGAQGQVTEDTLLQATGTVSVSDVDFGEDQVKEQMNTAGLFGTFSITSAGAWTYVLDNTNADVQALGEGDTTVDTFTVTSLDGSASDVVEITITGMNDGAEVIGDLGNVTEDGGNASTDAGTVSVSDVDLGEDQVIEQMNTAGMFGTFSINSAGAWTYVLDNTNSDVQALGLGDTLTESFTFTSLDGTASDLVIITITGTNDAPQAEDDSQRFTADSDAVFVFGSSSDGLLSNDSDIDGDDLEITEAGGLSVGTTIEGNFGSLIVQADGGYTYSINEAARALQAGVEGIDEFSYEVSDGDLSDTATLEVTVVGVNDAPDASDDNFVVNEASDLGTPLVLDLLLNDSDVDDNLTLSSIIGFSLTNDANSTFDLAVFGTYGAIGFAGDGTVNYLLTDNSLNAGEQEIETFFYQISDGESTSVGKIDLTINGSNVIPEISIVGPATIDEDAGTAEYTVTLSEATASQISVDISTTDGFAEQGSDFNAAAKTLTFAPNVTAQTFIVTIEDDAADEPNEDYSVFISNPVGGATLSNASSVTTQIIDNDITLPTISITADNTTVIEGLNNSATFTLNLDSSLAEDVIVEVELSGLLLGDDVDWAQNSNGQPTQEFVIGAGNTSLSFDVDILNEGILENDEDFSLTILSAQTSIGGQPVLLPIDSNTGVATTTIIDRPDFVVTRTASGTVLEDDSPNFDFEVKLNEINGTGADVTVDLSLIGSASQGSDYDASYMGGGI